MGIYRGPNNVTKDLDFGYDTGYGVSDNDTSTRFYPGQPTTNMHSSNQTSGQLAGMSGVSVTYVGEEDGFSKYSMNGTFSSGTYPYIMHIAGAAFTGGVKYSSQAKVKTNVPHKFNYFGTNGLSYVNAAMDHSGANSSTLTDEGCYLLQRQGFAYTSTTTQVGYLWTNPINNTTFAAATDFVYIKDMMTEQNDHCTPHTKTSRSDTASLIDLKRTTSIDVGDVSFDSNAQLDYDGSSDYIGLSHANSPITNVSYELVIKFDTIPATNSYCSVFQKSSNWNNAGGIMMHFIYGSWRWCYGNSWGGAVSYASSNFTTGKYYHIVGTVDNINGAGAKLYINGVQVSSTGTGSKPNSTANLEIGRGNGGRHNGKIDVFKMYENTLTAEDVKQNYNTYKNRFNL